MRTAFVRTAATILLLAATANVAAAAGVVGTGTPESCSEAALESALVVAGTVTFDCGPLPHTIIVGTAKFLLEGEYDIDGEDLVTLSGGNTTPFFILTGGATLILNRLTLTLGFGPFGAIQNSGTLIIQDARIENCNSTGELSGAITNYGTLEVLASTFSENVSAYRGGAIYNDGGAADIALSTFVANSTSPGSGQEGGAIYGTSGTLHVADSTFSGNFSQQAGAIRFNSVGSLTNVDFVGNRATTGGGGAVFVWDLADVVIEDSRFEGNEAVFANGGAIFVSGLLAVERTTFVENEAPEGGGISSRGETEVSESLFYGNQGDGAAIFGQGGSIVLRNSTVSDNGPGSAIVSQAGTVEIHASTVAGNAGVGLHVIETGGFVFSNSIFAYNTFDCFSLQDGSSLGFNISSDDTCQLVAAGDDPLTDPLLGPLDDNGGPTLTRLPGPLSPAIDTGQCLASTDQRGVVRPQGAACDRGAVERSPDDPGEQVCGDPVALVATHEVSTDAAVVTASDALAVLNAAVGLFACELCVCDVDDSGSITATDALTTLREAVGLGGTLDCPVCL